MENIETTEESSLAFMVTAVSSAVALLYYYVSTVSQKPKVHTSNSRMLKFLNSHVRTIQDKFYPSWYMWEGRLQSMLGLALRLSDSHSMPYERVILKLSDGGQLGLDILHPQAQEKKLLILIFPGMTSSSRTSYIKTISLSLVNSGATTIIINNRGLGGVPLTTPRTYCAIIPDDIRDVLNYVKTNYPNQKILPIGTSLGGMILCNFLKCYPEEAKKNFIAAVVVSICWCVKDGCTSLETPFVNKYIVNYGITQNLKHLAIKYRKVLEVRKCLDFDKVIGCRTIREFDSCFTVPQFGFKDVLEYYNSATIINDIHKFSIPVIGINAEDDPMQPGDSLPIKQAEMDGSNLAMIITARGGHLGFIDGILPIRKKVFYLERLLNDIAYAVRVHGNEISGESSNLIDCST